MDFYRISVINMSTIIIYQQWTCWHRLRHYYNVIANALLSHAVCHYLLLPCAHMHSRVMRLVTLVCVRTYKYICIYMSTKNRLFSALLLKNFLLSVICCWLFEFKCLQCGLLHPASSTDRAIWFGRVGLCIYVYVNLYNIMSTKSRLFSALLLKNL